MVKPGFIMGSEIRPFSGGHILGTGTGAHTGNWWVWTEGWLGPYSRPHPCSASGPKTGLV